MNVNEGIHKAIRQIYEDHEKSVRVLQDPSSGLSIDLFNEDLYPDEAHFIYELLQNAEDAEATNASFELSDGKLIFEHNGCPFNEYDIRAITSTGQGTKKGKDEQIGCFGIGFKSVFAYTETPRIWSPSCSFEILQKMLPKALRSDPRKDKRKTQFEFRFNSEKKPKKQAFSEIENGLAEISDNTLLFLSHIKEIKWQIGRGKTCRISSYSELEPHIEIRREINETKIKSSHFLRFKEPIKNVKSQQHIAIAFELKNLSDNTHVDQNTPLGKQFQIVPAKPGYVAVYFPAKKETSNLCFHLHAPFHPDLSRSSIKDTSVNKRLFKQLSKLCANSLVKIRKLGLLSHDFLKVLPIPKDNIPRRYECLRTAIVDAMKKKRLTPTHSKRYEPADQLLQTDSALKALLNGKDIPVLTNYKTISNWVISARQRNGRVDSFLKSLDIQEWDTEHFVDVLEQRLTNRKPDKNLLSWLKTKTIQWHQELYATFQKEKVKIDQLKDLRIVLISTKEYRVGRECYFPTDKGQTDLDLPFVARDIYTAGENKTRREDAKNFLEAVGVQEVGEREQVEAILEKRYTANSRTPTKIKYEEDLKKFISLVDDEDKQTAKLFAKYRIFERKDKKWARPNLVYLDSPYLDTGLDAFYQRPNHKDNHPVALSPKYKNLHSITEKQLIDFAKNTGVLWQLRIEKQPTKRHRNGKRLQKDYYKPGVSISEKTKIDEDWTIPGLKSQLGKKNKNISLLLWRTMKETEKTENRDYLTAQFRPNQKYETKKEPSTLVLELREAYWVPQGNKKFVRPAEALQNLLPSGFAFDAGWSWIKEIGFGEGTSKSEEEQRNQQELEKFGFESNEELNRAKKFAKLPQKMQEDILKKYSRVNLDLPKKQPKDPEIRAKYVREQVQHAPERTTENRQRSVSVNYNESKEEAKSYLRELYTNPDGKMICQICKEVLPFKLPNGEYYFEAVEFLLELKEQKYHRANHIALCPNHAAMYKYVNESKKTITGTFRELNQNSLKVVLADDTYEIYFVETHVFDLKTIVGSEKKSVF